MNLNNVIPKCDDHRWLIPDKALFVKWKQKSYIIVAKHDGTETILEVSNEMPRNFGKAMGFKGPYKSTWSK